MRQLISFLNGVWQEREKERDREKREKGKMFILTCDNYDVYGGIQKQAERRGER